MHGDLRSLLEVLGILLAGEFSQTNQATYIGDVCWVRPADISVSHNTPKEEDVVFQN